jgi:hypothetical protein
MLNHLLDAGNKGDIYLKTISMTMPTALKLSKNGKRYLPDK